MFFSNISELSDRNLLPRRKSGEANELDVPDNNGLSRGQNFMKVEKWLRDSCMQQQILVTPGVIKNIEDGTTGAVQDAEEPPPEKDRLPANLVTSQSHSKRR